MTVVTVVAIAAVGAFFYAFVWPNIKTSITNSTKCSQAICTNCTDGADGVRNCDCATYNGSDGTADWQGKCQFKN